MSDKGSKTKSVEWNPLDITKPEETPTELAQPLAPLKSGDESKEDPGLEPKVGWLEPQLNTNWSIEPAATEEPEPLWHLDTAQPPKPEPSGFEGNGAPSKTDIAPTWTNAAPIDIPVPEPLVPDSFMHTPLEEEHVDEQLVPPQDADLPALNELSVVNIPTPKSELSDSESEPETAPEAGGFKSINELPPVHFMPDELPLEEEDSSEDSHVTGGTNKPIPSYKPVLNADASKQLEHREGTREFKLSETIQTQLDLLQKQIRTIETTNADKKLNDNQQDVLRKYVALKDAENRDLTDQKRHYQVLIEKLETETKSLSIQNQVLSTELELLKTREESNRRDLLSFKEKYQEELRRQKADFEQKLLEASKNSSLASELEQKKEQWKSKIKEELNRIKLKERELENKYELLKRDTEALLDSKDQHVLELKRKNDALELEMDALEEKLRNANTLLSQMDSKRQRLMETFRLASALLEKLDKPDPS